MTYHVAPFPGAWIEIPLDELADARSYVAPFPGAWIEIISIRWDCRMSRVAPFPGAWIEIIRIASRPVLIAGRSLPGSVD